MKSREVYEIIEKNDFGYLVKNTTTIEDKQLCKYDCDVCESIRCSNGYYYLTDKEAEKLN